MDKKQLQTSVVTAVVTALLMVGINFIVHHKSRPARVLPRNVCAESAYKKYLSQRLEVDKSINNQSVEKSTTPQFLAIRRLQENFCSEFVACTDGDAPSHLGPISESMAFESCIKDEEKSDDQNDDGNN